MLHSKYNQMLNLSYFAECRSTSG